MVSGPRSAGISSCSSLCFVEIGEDAGLAQEARAECVSGNSILVSSPTLFSSPARPEKGKPLSQSTLPEWMERLGSLPGKLAESCFKHALPPLVICCLALCRSVCGGTVAARRQGWKATPKVRSMLVCDSGRPCSHSHLDSTVTPSCAEVAAAFIPCQILDLLSYPIHSLWFSQQQRGPLCLFPRFNWKLHVRHVMYLKLCLYSWYYAGSAGKKSAHHHRSFHKSLRAMPCV